MVQERKKRRIVLTSILKPVDDTRMFEKMGVSLAQSGQYEVFIIGYPTSPKPTYTGIHFISLPQFQRVSLKRVLAKWSVFRKIIQLRPWLVIITTHELLLPAIILKALIRTKIVYDIRENYYRNILYSGSFPMFARWPLALLVRLKEELLAPVIDHLFLAEKGYENEFRFQRDRWTVIENKALLSPPTQVVEEGVPLGMRKELKDTLQLLFSGTLAESTGVFRAIQLCKELHRLDPTVSLTIVGRAALVEVNEKIQKEIKQYPFISLIGGNSLVPHRTVMEYIRNSDYGIISYPPSEHTVNSHPTKLFEYLSARLPIILEPHWPWITQYEVYQPFILVDFQKPNYPGLLQDMKSKAYYTRTPEDVSWSSEEPKFLKALEIL